MRRHLIDLGPGQDCTTIVYGQKVISIEKTANKLERPRRKWQRHRLLSFVAIVFLHAIGPTARVVTAYLEAYTTTALLLADVYTLREYFLALDVIRIFITDVSVAPHSNPCLTSYLFRALELLMKFRNYLWIQHLGIQCFRRCFHTG